MALVMACQEMAPKMEAPPEVVEPTLHGTWTMKRDWWEEDEQGVDRIVGTRTYVLTFTETRWIEYEVQRLTDGTWSDDHAERGTWTVSGDTVIRTWIDDGRETAVAKDYHLTNGSLFVHPWRYGDDHDHSKFEKYERVTDLPAIVGTWTATDIRAGDDGAPGAVTDTRTVTVGGDGKLEYSRDVEWATGNFSGRMTGDTGDVVVDAANLFVIVSNGVFQRTASYEEFDDITLGADDWVRFAYAPTDRADTIIVSPFSEEADSGAFRDAIGFDEPDWLYGNYWLVLERR